MLALLFSVALAVRPAAVDALIADPHGTLDRSGVPRGLQMVVLSNVADGCARDDDASCVRAMADAALDPRVASSGGLYDAHLAIVLGAEAAVGEQRHAAKQARLARALFDATMSDPWHNPPSYRGDPSRWPADQAAAIYAIHRYDPALAQTAFAAWRSVIAHRGTDGTTGLPVSELTGAHGYSAIPRGCALMWTVAYLAPVDHAYADGLWDDSRAAMMLHTPMGPAMREYPAGREQPSDYDSGPIVMGIGAAASAFAVGAAEAVGDGEYTVKLRTAEKSVRTLVEQAGPPEVAAVSQGVLAESIRYRWFP